MNREKFPHFFKNDELLSDKNDMGAVDVEEMIHGICKGSSSYKEGNDLILIEPVCNCGTVFIFGAGHVSQIANLTARLIFELSY